MRVAQLRERHRFHLTEQPAEDPGPGQIQVKVHSVGVCGSDLHNFTEGSVGDMPSQYPMVLGHEPAGTVVATGAGVSGWSAGDRALLEPAIYCYHCPYCISGHHNVCANIRFLSQPGDPGFFRDYANLPAGNLLPLPSGMSFDEGTLFEPLAVVLHSMKFAAVAFGETAAVFGAGPIGLLTIATLKLAGAARVLAVEPVQARRELALAVGADAAIDPQSVDIRKTLVSETGGRGVDLAIDCAARASSLNDCLHATRNAGRVVVTGIHCEPAVELDLHVARRKELGFFSVRRSSHESDAAIQLLADRPELFRKMLTHTYPVERIQEGFETLEAYADGVGKIIIRLD